MKAARCYATRGPPREAMAERRVVRRATSLIVLGVLSIDEAYHGVSWTTVILMAGMIPLSAAMIDSGAAAELADRLVAVVGGAGPYALLAGPFVLAVVLGQLIRIVATALIVIPIALSAASDMHVSVKPVLMAVPVFWSL